MTGCCFISAAVSAKGQTQSALTLIEPSGARTAALGEASSALADDITAVAYNPALLQTLSSGQVSLLFQRGLSEDGYGRLALGSPRGQMAWGAMVGYYDSGSIEVFDGRFRQTAVGQKDLTAGLSLSRKFSGFSAGFTGKFLSTQLAKKSSARAFAADVGLAAPLSSGIGFGLAVQNVGNKLRYANASENLPRQIRGGLSFSAKPYALPAQLLTEAVYVTETNDLNPAVGLEVLTGPLALRAGYRSGRDLDEVTVGSGFFWGTSSLDYAFGFANQSSTHRFSFSSRFGGTVSSPIVKKPAEKTAPAVTFVAPTPRPVYELKPAPGVNPAARVYFIRPGDTLKSIARAIYGREDMWDEIFRANQHLLGTPDNVKEGDRILLPGSAQ